MTLILKDRTTNNNQTSEKCHSIIYRKNLTIELVLTTKSITRNLHMELLEACEAFRSF